MSNLNKKIPSNIVILGLVLVLLAFVPHVLNIFYPENNIIRTLSSDSNWIYYVIVLAIVGTFLELYIKNRKK